MARGKNVNLKQGRPSPIQRQILEGSRNNIFGGVKKMAGTLGEVHLSKRGLLLVAQNLRSDGSGFDAYSSCYRKSRQRPLLPCDFAKQSWCSIPGSTYPWHAVRRFVHENQGLMRRMYGDERHISVIRAELDNNEIEFFHDAKDDGRSHYTKQMSSTLLRPEGRKLSKFKKAILHSDKNDNNINKNSFKLEAKNSFTDYSKSTPLLTLKPLTTQEALLSSSTSTTVVFNDTTPQTTTTNISTNESPLPSTETPSSTVQSQIEVSEASQDVDNSTVPPTEVLTETSMDNPETEVPYTTTDTDAEFTTEDGDVEEEEVGDEVYEDSLEDSIEDVDETREPESQKPPPILRLKGINACPVKEEVIAPFWANNTRGEVLALLNLYPFEQYVHWEKCSYEHKQMFCREGCRCEQQYRLHRLLAYDPNNECRGIFSDWFRFPSCCICKCYDVPMEFRLTSRSPRSPTIADLEPGPT